MPLASRRTLAILTVAATLALASSPTVARSLPTPNLEANRSPIQQFLQGATAWVHSLLAPLWDATGSGLDPSGSHANGDTGSGLDPDGRT